MPGSAIVDIRNTYGAIFIGMLFNFMLFGFEIVQAYIYYSTYWNRDTRAFKFFVAFLLVMDTMSTIVCAYGIYWHLVRNFGNLESLASPVRVLDLQSVFTSLTSTAVQLYYARRVYLISQSLICPILVVPFSLGISIMGIYSPIKASVKDVTQYGVPKPIWLPCFLMSASVFVDIVITVTMCWALYHKMTGFTRSDSIIMTLVVCTVNSGVLLSALGIAVTITFTIAPSTMIWFAIYWVSCKCYINSLLTMLNTRDYIRYRPTTDNPGNAYDLSSIRIEPPSEAYSSKSRQPGVTLTLTVHHSTASEILRSESDHTTEPTFEDPKPGCQCGTVA
ncbi:hypothetical protein EI94DRAFT_1745926 [Lactarius quietus]|nr:hypothetical protein EI94DRAFT_1745926 [Lactarius quietus]